MINQDTVEVGVTALAGVMNKTTGVVYLIGDNFDRGTDLKLVVKLGRVTLSSSGTIVLTLVRYDQVKDTNYRYEVTDSGSTFLPIRSARGGYNDEI